MKWEIESNTELLIIQKTSIYLSIKCLRCQNDESIALWEKQLQPLQGDRL